MLLARIDPKNIDRATLEKAVAVLKSGGLVVYPTETAYAIGCDPENRAAMKRLFAVKGRDASKPVPLIAASVSMARAFCAFDRYARMLSDAFWPGPLTLVVPSLRGKGSIALRVSSAPWPARLSAALGKPIVSTSANASGRSARYDVASVLLDLGAVPGIVLDAGVLKKMAPSTIIRAHGGFIEFLRQGPISEDDVHRELMKRL